MYDEFIKIEGKEQGPISVILAGVHGDEKCGMEAFERILPILTIKRGAVFFGYGNPRAIEQSVRSTEANLNRMFKPDAMLSEKERGSYEYRRAQFLKKYFNQADALLDIHASYTPDSKPFIICEPNAAEITRYLPFNLIVSGFDEVEPGGTDYYMNSIGKIGICIECDYVGNPATTEIACESIHAFLAARKHIDGEVKTRPQSRIKMYYAYMTKTDSFVITREFRDFETVKKGELIGMDGGVEVRSPEDSLILFASSCTEANTEGFLLGKV